MVDAPIGWINAKGPRTYHALLNRTIMFEWSLTSELAYTAHSGLMSSSSKKGFLHMGHWLWNPKNQFSRQSRWNTWWHWRVWIGSFLRTLSRQIELNQHISTVHDGWPSKQAVMKTSTVLKSYHVNIWSDCFSGDRIVWIDNHQILKGLVGATLSRQSNLLSMLSWGDTFAIAGSVAPEARLEYARQYDLRSNLLSRSDLV